MVWVRIEPTILGNRKFKAAKLSGAARLLWHDALSYCALNQTNGCIATDDLVMLRAMRMQIGCAEELEPLVDELVQKRFWDAVVDGDENGWQVHDYSDYQAVHDAAGWHFPEQHLQGASTRNSGRAHAGNPVDIDYLREAKRFDKWRLERM
jgi:hypothetical protein